MWNLKKSRSKLTEPLPPAAEKVVRALAGRLLIWKERCATWLDKQINSRSLAQKKTIMWVFFLSASIWCLYLLVSGVMS